MRFLKILFMTLISNLSMNYYACHSLIADDGQEIATTKSFVNDIENKTKADGKENDIADDGESAAVDDNQDTAARSRKIEAAKSFIEDTGNQVIKILVNKSIPLVQRQDQFRQIIKSKFHMPSIGKFVLGRYWNQATPDQREDYLKLFEDSIVESYSHQFDNYTKEQLKVISGRPSNNGGIIVTSKIIRASGAPLQVDWKVFRIKGNMRILDVLVGGVSMSLTYRTEYANAYNKNGRSIDGLLKALRSHELTTKLPEASGESPIKESTNATT